MRTIITIRSHRRRLYQVFFFSILLFAASHPATGQEPPPRLYSVTWGNKNLSFGAFYQGASGGSITVNSSGGRSATPGIVLLNMGYSVSTALFEVVATPGTVLSFLKPEASLSDGNGHFMTLQIGDSNPEPPFVTTLPVTTFTPVNIGGILDVRSPAANPPGNYTGTFDITFNQE